MDEYPIIDLSHLLPAAGLGPSSGGRAHPAPSRRPLDRLSARSRGAEPAGSPLCVAKQATHAQPAAGWPDQQWQVDDRREVPPHPPGQLRRRPEHIPVLVVQMPSEPSVIRFYVALLAAMGAPLRPRPRLPEMEQLALALLRKVGVRMLVIVDNLSRNQDIAVGLQVILKPRARPTPTWTSMPERTLDFEF